MTSYILNGVRGLIQRCSRAVKNRDLRYFSNHYTFAAHAAELSFELARKRGAERDNLRAAISEIAEITSRGTSPNGTTRKIAGIASGALS